MTATRVGCAILLGMSMAWAQNLLVPVGDREGLPKTAKKIERHGIAWTFAQEHVVGAFANGDPWVLGPVEVIAIHPKTTVAKGRAVHGSMINPDPSTEVQGYDAHLYGPDTLLRDLARTVASRCICAWPGICARARHRSHAAS